MTEGEDIHSIVRIISLARFLPLLKVTQAQESLPRPPAVGMSLVATLDVYLSSGDKQDPVSYLPAQ